MRFRSPPYLDREFEGSVIYSGDLVDEKSRTIKLLAQAAEPRPDAQTGDVRRSRDHESANEGRRTDPGLRLLDEGDRTFVYMKAGPDRFVRREVDAEPPRKGLATIRRGLEPGDEIVVEGEFKLKPPRSSWRAAGHD